MAQIIVVLGGLGDDPHEALDGRTPLAAAETPTLDRLAALSEVGLVQPLPELEGSLAVGTDQTTLALLGYEDIVPARGAVELLGAGASLGRRDVGLRFDLLHVGETVDPFPAEPTEAQAASLWEALEPALRLPDLSLRGVDPRKGLALWEEGPVEVQATPPGELDPDRSLDEQVPVGERDEAIRRMIDISREVLADHPVNRARAEAELPTLDVAWPWGFGRAPELPLFVLRAQQIVTLVTSNLAPRGIGRAAGVSVARRMPDELRTPANRLARILGALEHAPTVYAHLSDLDRLAHGGEAEAKLQHLERLDRELFTPLVAHLERHRDIRLTVLGDFATSSTTRRHRAAPTPYLQFDPAASRSGPGAFNEEEAAETGRQRYGAADLRALLWS